MKSFCKAGRLASVLKLELPQIKESADEESGAALRFNKFYLSVAEAYQALAGKIADSAADGVNQPVRVSVSYRNATNEYKEQNEKRHKSPENTLVIQRFVRINPGGSIKTKEYTDVFDCDGGFFVK